MTKVCRRKNNCHRRRQLISKRGWLLHRPSKVGRKVHRNAKLAAKSERELSEELDNLQGASAICGEETHWQVVARKFESFPRCFILSLSYTASSPISLFCACMSLCCNGFKKGLVAVNKGKEKVHTTLSSSMFNGFFQLKKV